MREPAFMSVPSWPDTFGDVAADVAVQVGRPMDPEQRLILDATFAESRPGIPSCFEVAAIAPRQNLKTATLQVAALTDVFVLGEKLHVWTAHLFPTAQAAFTDMVGMIDSVPDFSRRVLRVRTANGTEAVELKSGAKLIFRARSKGGGRGLAGNRLTFDEALFLDGPLIGALLPILATWPGAQVRYGSSAGLSSSRFLRTIRDRGRRGGEPKLAYFEWSAPPADCDDPRCPHLFGVEGCVLDRDDLLEAANPALGGRISWEVMRDFRRAMPAEEFRREFLGWWDDPATAEALFGAGNWEACAVLARPEGLKVGSLGLAVSMDLTRAAVGAAGVSEGVTHVMPLHHAPGTGQLVEWAKAEQLRHGVDVVVDGRGPAATWIPALEREGVRLRIASTGDVLDSCAGIYSAVQARTLSHCAYPELDAAVEAAVKRDVGERWALGRKASSADISPLEAVTLAAWGTGETPKRSAYEDRGLLVV